MTLSLDKPADKPPARRLPVPPRRRSEVAVAVTVVGIAAVAALHWVAWDQTDATWSGLFHTPQGLWTFLRGDETTTGAIPPQWKWNELVWPGIKQCLVTLSMGLLGTTISIPFAFVLSLLGSQTTSRNPVVYWCARMVMSFFRAVPIFVWGLICLMAVGLGSFPAALAIAIHNMGIMGKLWSEAMEEIELGPVDALRTAGARNLQTIVHVVLPSVTTQFVSVLLYRVDVNIREAAMLGAVGAGGIGLLLTQSIQLFQFDVLMTYIILVLVMIFTVDIISALLRRRLSAR